MRDTLRHRIREHLALARFALRWLPLAALIAVPVGSASALFLWALERATAARAAAPWLLYGLPACGAVIGAVYHRWGRSVEGGNNLIVECIHDAGAPVPRRLTPLILLSTVATHLFGGSAGREGTAVQMGGGLASAVARGLGLSSADSKVALTAGVAAGFGAVFGTPLAGAVFAMEVLVVGAMRYEALVPCLVASVLSDLVCRAWGIRHTAYAVAPLAGAELGAVLLAKAALAGAAFGVVGLLFAEGLHGLTAAWKRLVPSPWLRPVTGGVAVIVLARLAGTTDFLGLGVSSADPAAVTIVSAFRAGGAGAWSWAAKLLFTVTTLAAGFKGGEVTPLFYIGATLGNALSRALSAPTDLFAALGFVAVFAGAANTPLACTVMGVELFGGQGAPYGWARARTARSRTPATARCARSARELPGPHRRKKGMKLAALLKETRAERRISQRQLADVCRVPASLVCRVERGADARLSTWLNLFEGLGSELRFELQETAEDMAGWLADEAEKRRRRRDEGLCTGKDRW
ncbi:MAG: chloride channel protein [Elusimicrobia bacterium]|nr:chloride channel protein [Elusimicrobiota bacterium]